MISRRLLTLFALGVLASTGSIQAAEPEVQLVIKNHRFEPAELKVPAGQRIKLGSAQRRQCPEHGVVCAKPHDAALRLREHGDSAVRDRV